MASVSPSHADPTFFVSCCFCASQDGYLRAIACEQPLFTHVACGLFTPGGCLADAEKLLFAASSAQSSYRGHYLVNPAVDLLRNASDKMLREYAQSSVVRPFFALEPLATTVLADTETPTRPQFLLRPAFFKLPSAYTEKKLCDQQYLSSCIAARLALRPAARLSPRLPADLAERATDLGLYAEAPEETPRELRLEGGLCMYCRLSFGVALRCAEPGCPAAYHFSCHYYAGGWLHVPLVTEYVGGMGHPVETFCPVHALRHGYEGAAQLRECLARNLRRCNPFMDMALAQALLRGDNVDEGVSDGVSGGNTVDGVSDAPTAVNKTSDTETSNTNTISNTTPINTINNTTPNNTINNTTPINTINNTTPINTINNTTPNNTINNTTPINTINNTTPNNTINNTTPINTIINTTPINTIINTTHTNTHHALLPRDQLLCDVCGYGYYCPRETLDCTMRNDVREPVHLQPPPISPRDLDPETACRQLEAELETLPQGENSFACGNRGDFWVCCVCGCHVHASCFDVSDYVPLYSRGGIHCGGRCATTRSLHLHALSAQLRAISPRRLPPAAQRDLSPLRPLPRVSGVHDGRVSGAQAVRAAVAGKHLPSAGQRLLRQNRRLGAPTHLHPVRASPAEVLGHRGLGLPPLQRVREFRGERGALQCHGVHAGRGRVGVSARWCTWAVWTVVPSSTSPPPRGYL